MPETLRRSTLGGLRAGDRVNLEPALRVGDRLGGHWVQGHVDGVGRAGVGDARGRGGQPALLGAAPQVLRYTIEKGSITVAGVSLTVVDVDDDGLLGRDHPAHPRGHDRWASAVSPDRVNLEADILAKYVEKLVNPGGLWYHRGGAKIDPRPAPTRSSIRTSTARRSRTVDEAVDEIRAGRMVIVVDSPTARTRATW